MTTNRWHCQAPGCTRDTVHPRCAWCRACWDELGAVGQDRAHHLGLDAAIEYLKARRASLVRRSGYRR